ncbi:MAG TPA: substrate-binding domain-containing protein [Candidatus Saccharimonadales bacterium]|nr:substrate-binding domain-containing protein [Candidatus Saccharimonadales bacterium]
MNEENTNVQPPATPPEVPTEDAHVQGTPKSKKGLIVTLAVVAVIVLAAGGFGIWKMMANKPTPKAAVKPVRIGLSLDTLKIQRWSDERDIMAKKATAMGATLTTLVAEGDNQVQVDQIDNFITQKVDVIILVSADATGVAPAIERAHKAGIKVIDYDRLNIKADSDLYMSFDSVKVGVQAADYVVKAIPATVKVPKIAFLGGSTTDNNAFLVKDGAMSILDPIVKSGKATLVFDKFITDWSPSEAYTEFKKFLDGGGQVDAVVTSYDGLAFGAIRALHEKGLDGKVPVSGQNGELQAIQRIAAGTQTMTAYKPGKPLAEKTIALAIDMANGKKITTTGVTNNKQRDVPSYLFDPIPVTKDNIKDTVIKDGTFTAAQIYGAGGQ